MRVRALETFSYAGRELRSGEIFDTENDLHARLLAQNKKVEIVLEITEEEMAPFLTREFVDPPKEKVNKGRYRRRDVRADE